MWQWASGNHQPIRIGKCTSLHQTPPKLIETGVWMEQQMKYLYLNVVKARNLPFGDDYGFPDPYIEVKIGNFKGITRHFENNRCPEWMQTFAFSKQHLQSDFLELVVKDKQVRNETCIIGRLVFSISEAPVCVPSAATSIAVVPQWYNLFGDNKGEKNLGEVMVSMWVGTQADPYFYEAWHLNPAYPISRYNHDVFTRRSKVYYSPKLYYLRIQIIEAQNLAFADYTTVQHNFLVKVQVGNQLQHTSSSMSQVWNQVLMFVVAEPMDERVFITAVNRLGPNNDQIIGELSLPVSAVRTRFDTKEVDAQWLPLQGTSSSSSSKICIRLCIDGGYHVLDNDLNYSSDFQPSAKQLQKPSVGVLEVGILNAKNLVPMKINARGKRTTDAFCVAMYGSKWVRTRTRLTTLSPQWNEQYHWEVYDPNTVLTVAVFDNGRMNDISTSQDLQIGKVRIRISTLETDKWYTNYYSMSSLYPSGVKKKGEIQLALRFKCTDWMTMLGLYTKPLLPEMHYLQPISSSLSVWLRQYAEELLKTRLASNEPPLGREVVEYMLYHDLNTWSLRRSKAILNHIVWLLDGVQAINNRFSDICKWKNPQTTCLAHGVLLILVLYPELIPPMFFVSLILILGWKYQSRRINPPDHIEHYAGWIDPDELDEEFDTIPTSRPAELVRMRYDRLRGIAGRIQTLVGDLAMQGERVQGLLSNRDPMATAIFFNVSLLCAIAICLTPIKVVAMLVVLYLLRHPRFRSELPSTAFCFFVRLPSMEDVHLWSVEK